MLADYRVYLACCWLVAASLLLAGCGAPAASPPPATSAAAPSGAAPAAAPARPTTPAEIAAYRGPDRQQLLEEGARREGTIGW